MDWRRRYGAFLLLRMLFGIGMGGEWGVGASLALESASPRIRGLLSGLLQEGYAIGNLLAAIVFRTIYPVANAHYPGNGWRVMFFLGGVPALLSLFIRARVKRERGVARAPDRLGAAYRRSIVSHWRRFLYLVLLMAMMNFMSHGTQDMYPTLLTTLGYTQRAHRGHHDPVDDRRRHRRPRVRPLLGPVGPAPRDDERRRGRPRSSCRSGSPARARLATIVGVFLMQFFVQGAWGVCRRTSTSCRPAPSAASCPGSPISWACCARRASRRSRRGSASGSRYRQSMGGLMIVVFIGAMLVIAFGPENRGVSFRKAKAETGPALA